MDNTGARHTAALLNNSSDITTTILTLLCGILDISLEPNANVIGPLDELQRLERMENAFAQLHRCTFRPEQREDSQIACQKLAANHAVEIVDRFLDITDKIPSQLPQEAQLELRLNNAYMFILCELYQISYLHKYFESKKPAASNKYRLRIAVLERLADTADIWDRHLRNPPSDKSPDYYKNIIQRIIRILLLMHPLSKHSQEEISPSLATRVVPWLKRWSSRTELGLASECRTIITVLEDRKTFRFSTTMVRSAALDVCRLPRCGREGKGFRICGKCQLNHYCCPEHQKEHWKLSYFGHKRHCFETIF